MLQSWTKLFVETGNTITKNKVIVILENLGRRNYQGNVVGGTKLITLQAESPSIRVSFDLPRQIPHISCRHKCFPFACERNICGHKFCVRDTKNVSDFVQKHFVSATNVSMQFAQHKEHHEQQCVRNNVSSFARAFNNSVTKRTWRWHVRNWAKQ